MNKTVTDITPKLQKDLRKLRVAAYARVSCDKDAMLHSLDAQIRYYRNLIRGNPDWEFAGIYADEAKTGTKESREQFQQLLSDCLYLRSVLFRSALPPADSQAAQETL